MKLDVTMAEIIAINGLILGDTEEEIFVVEIPGTKTISDLKEVMKTKAANIFGDVVARKIALCTGHQRSYRAPRTKFEGVV